MSLTPPLVSSQPWGRHPRPLPAGVSVSSSVRWGGQGLPSLPSRKVEDLGTQGWGKSKGVTDVRGATIPSPPGRSGPKVPRVPICPPHPPRPRGFFAARLNINTQGKLQGKHTADKNLMLYVTKQNEYLIRAFMRNHITNRPHAAARALDPSLHAPSGAWQRSS